MHERAQAVGKGIVIDKVRDNSERPAGVEIVLVLKPILANLCCGRVKGLFKCSSERA